MSNKNLLDSIKVESPCGEKWNEMTGNETVRFCSHCAKNVHNISRMTRKRARRLVANSNGSLCVQYVRRADGRIETLKRELIKITRQTGVAAKVLGASLALSTAAGAQTANQNPNQQTVAAANQIQANDQPSATVSGTITDPNNAVVAFALVTLSNPNTSFYQTANTNNEGFYEFKNVPAGNYSLKIDAGGFDSKEFAQLSIGGDNVQNAQLVLQSVQEVVQVGGENIDRDQSVTVGITVSMSSYKRNKLVQAVESNDIEAVIKRIRKGDRVNAKDKGYDGNTALHVAVENGNVEIARYLLSAGAKANAKNNQKQTPLMLLDEDAKPELVAVLLSYGAKINLVDKEGNTPLTLAAQSANKDTIQLLINAGANPHQQNGEGRTALMNAVESGNLETVKILLGAGANVNIVDAAGKTALLLAETDELKQLLVAYGAINNQTAENQ